MFWVGGRLKNVFSLSWLSVPENTTASQPHLLLLRGYSQGLET